MNYWEDKNNRIIKAKEHIAFIDKNYKAETNICVGLTTIEKPVTATYRVKSTVPTNIIVEKISSVDAVFKYKTDKKIAVLNFASYKEPGGMFLKGSNAQEESLCHASNLYIVLEHFQESYYNKNKERLNRALYTNKALYSPNILFFEGNNVVSCDVISCAAPNKSAAQKYCQVPDIECNLVLKSRIDFVLEIAKRHNVKTLVLGAFGCGVFKNNPSIVADEFRKLLAGKYKGCFENVIFAIIDDETVNVFKGIL